MRRRDFVTVKPVSVETQQPESESHHDVLKDFCEDRNWRFPENLGASRQPRAGWPVPR